MTPPVADTAVGEDAAILRTPVALGRLALANRIVMAPMTRSRAHDDGTPHQRSVLYYAQRAAAGLIVSEGTCISPQGVARNPNVPGIWREEHVRGWEPVTEAVHAAGGTIVLQLWHTGRASDPSRQPGGAVPVGPSARAIDPTTYATRSVATHVVPRALARDELPGVAADYARAARNALRAGFDGVEIHAANGYLLDQFLHASANTREDEYGGTPERRTRFLGEVAEAVCAEAGADRVGVRLSPASTFQDMHDPERPAVFAAALDRLRPLGLAYLHIVEPGISGALSVTEPEGSLDSRWVRARWPAPLVATGGYDARSAAAAIAADAADAVGFGRLFLANPDLPERLAHGLLRADAERSALYGGGDAGYLDFPSLQAERLLAELRSRAGRATLPDVAPLSGQTPVADWPLAWAVAQLRDR